MLRPLAVSETTQSSSFASPSAAGVHWKLWTCNSPSISKRRSAERDQWKLPQPLPARPWPPRSTNWPKESASGCKLKVIEAASLSDVPAALSFRKSDSHWMTSTTRPWAA